MKKLGILLSLLVCSILFTGCLHQPEVAQNDTSDLQNKFLTAYGTEPFWDIEISGGIAHFASLMYDTDVTVPVTIWQEGDNYYFSGEELEGEFILKDCIDGGKGDMHYYTVGVSKFREYYYEGCGDGEDGIKMSDEEYEDEHSEFLKKYDGYIKNCEKQINWQISENVADVIYGWYNYSNIGDFYKIDGYVSYTLNDKFYTKDLFCAFTDGDFGEYGDEIEYNSLLRITTKDEEEQECIDTLDQYPAEQMPGNPETIITVSCAPANYGEYFVTGYIYTTIYPDLGLRITTPAGRRYYDEDSVFKDKSDKPVFVRDGNKISYGTEYIQVYEKDKNENLEDVIKTKHLKNDGCTIDKYPNYYYQSMISTPYPGTIIYSVVGESDNPYGGINPYAGESCVGGDGENYGLVRFFEGPDKTKYYKLVFSDGCAPGPCSIFGEVEVF